MKKIAFTICAKNYIGLAQALQSSIEEHNKDVLFFIFVADEFLPEEKIILPENVLIAKDSLDIPNDQWYQMAFKYDLTEFCTSIKPSCFKYLFKIFNDAKCIYFDPDILTYCSLETIFEHLDFYSIVLTPHITTIEDNYSGSLNERNLFYSGMFNLGFIAVNDDEIGRKVLNWWEIRLKDRCYQSMTESYFTDQKWIDFLPSFFPVEILISKNLGLNTAPWNFYEREIIEQDGCFFVKNRIKKNDTLFQLVFIHFSGFDYKALLENKLEQGNIKGLEVPNDFTQVFRIYTNALKASNIYNFINLNYTYNYFLNGCQVSSVHRKLFRRLYEDDKITHNPFLESSPFYISLQQNGLINKNIVVNDKKNLSNISNIEKTTIIINRVFQVVYIILGSHRFFLLVRLMRLYSKTENHVYLIEKSYFKRFKIWN